MNLDKLNFKGIIFDYNGTMYFDQEINELAWQILISNIVGYDVQNMKEFTKGFNTMHNKYYAEDLYKKLNVPYDKALIRQTWEKKESIYLELAKQRNMYELSPGISDFLDHLKQSGLPYNIASLAPDMNFDFYFSDLHLDKWFDRNTIVCDDGDTYDSKGPMYVDAAKKIGLDIKDCLVFEDSLGSIKGAAKAGCKQIILMEHDYNKHIEHPVIIKRIHNFKGLTLDNLLD